MEIVIAREVPIATRNEGGETRGGGVKSHNRQHLIGDDAPDGLNFTLSRAEWLAGGHPTIPRHHHAFQQIRWTESGSVNFGPDQDIEEGDIAYFPRGAYYGPQYRDRGIGLTIQFGLNGEKQGGKGYWEQFNASVLEKLRATGRFDEGLYYDVDSDTGEERIRDSSQAVHEERYFQATGMQYEIPDAGYDAAIWMHPQAFAYYEESPGVERKSLGRFYDHPGLNADVRLEMVRLSDHGTYTLDGDRAQVAWSKTDGLEIDDHSYPALTCLYSPRDEKLEVSGAGGVELHVVVFPRLD